MNKRLLKDAFIRATLRNQRRDAINKANREKLRNTDFSLISSNCNGGVMLHDLGLQFRSQFVNLWMRPCHFVKYLENFDYYNAMDEMRFLPESERRGHAYPIGVLEDLEIHFVHYHSDEEAHAKWNERKKRINKDNLYIMMNERDFCTMEDLIAFDHLPFSNKVVFTKLPYEGIQSAFYIPGYENEKELAPALQFKNIFSAKRLYDDFPYVDWFNGDYVVGRTEESR